MLKQGIRPSDIMTKQAINNALTMVMALGGSTNAVLHFLAIARAVGIDLTLDDFQRVSDQTPLIADLKPSGKYVMEDVHKVQFVHQAIPIGARAGVIRSWLLCRYLQPSLRSASCKINAMLLTSWVTKSCNAGWRYSSSIEVSH